MSEREEKRNLPESSVPPPAYTASDELQQLIERLRKRNEEYIDKSRTSFVQIVEKRVTEILDRVAKAMTEKPSYIDVSVEIYLKDVVMEILKNFGYDIEPGNGEYFVINLKNLRAKKFKEWVVIQ